jgi:hypothetical protein
LELNNKQNHAGAPAAASGMLANVTTVQIAACCLPLPAAPQKLGAIGSFAWLWLWEEGSNVG